jgi:hypothetical protein
MNPKQTSDLLEKYLQQIQAGMPLEQILIEGGPEAQSLLPLLSAAVEAYSHHRNMTIPPSAMNRSRAQFLTAAVEAKTPRLKAGWFSQLKWTNVMAALAGIFFIVALLSTGLDTAQALPGDTLYPVKMAVEQARLSLAPDTASRISLEETFDEERAEETHRLVQMGREGELSFAGYVHHENEEGWEVAGLRLQLTPQQEALITGMDRMYVEVEGLATAKGIRVKSISARLFEINGTVGGITPEYWEVGGVKVLITPQTKIQVQAREEARVYVSAIRNEDGDLVAVLISGNPINNFFYQPTTIRPPAAPQNLTAPTENNLPVEKNNSNPEEVSTPEIKTEETPESIGVPEATKMPEQEIKPEENHQEQPEQNHEDENSIGSKETKRVEND